MSLNPFQGRGSYPVRYGMYVLRNVTRINVLFGNKTVLGSTSGKIWDQMMEANAITGGNVAITVHGFFRDADRRVQVAAWEIARNVQALIASIPGGIKNGPSLGQMFLWIYSLFTPFQSEIAWQMNMVIKEMEFEHAAEMKDEYAYQITFEKLSWGMLQYTIDLIVSSVAGLLAWKDRGGMTVHSMFQDIENAMGSNRIVGSSVNSNVVNNIVSNVPDSEDVDQESSNNLSYFNVKTSIDGGLDWYEIPFMNVFPQMFSFDFNGHYYETEWRMMSIENEDDGVDYYLRLKLSEDGEVVYIGKIIEKIQYNFRSSIGIYIRDFKISVTDDGMILYTLKGMIADID